MNADQDNVKVIDHLKEVMALKIAEVKTILDERERMLKLTADDLKNRLERLNELRDEVTSDRQQFMTKAVYEHMHKALEDRMNKGFETSQREFERLSAFQSRTIGALLVLVPLSGILGGVVTHIFFK